jgi:hypothetical protein
VHVLVGLVVLRGEAGPTRQLGRPGEPVHVADLGHEHPRQRRPDPRDPLRRLVAGVGGPSGTDQPGQPRPATKTADEILETLAAYYGLMTDAEL